MNEREMFEKSFLRPTTYFQLSLEMQWECDTKLGILDWKGEGLTEADKERFKLHYQSK